MNSKVRVVGDSTTGAVINVSENNPEWGYVRVSQNRLVIGDNGFMTPKTLNFLIKGTVENLKMAAFYAGQELPGNILIEESLEPFNKKNPERDYKVAGDTGIVLTVNGSPIYRRTIYSASTNAEDTLIKHDNVEELRAAYSTKTSIKANTDFDNL